MFVRRCSICIGMRSFHACDPPWLIVYLDVHFHLNVLFGSLLATVDATSNRWPLMCFRNASRVLMLVSGGHLMISVVIVGYGGFNVSFLSCGPTSIGVPLLGQTSCALVHVLVVWCCLSGGLLWVMAASGHWVLFRRPFPYGACGGMFAWCAPDAHLARYFSIN